MFLDKHDMGPELYASAWFMTLHVSRTRSLSVVLRLWDLLLLDLGADPLLHFFLSLALLLSHRQTLLAEQPVRVVAPPRLSLLLCFSLALPARSTGCSIRFVGCTSH